MWPSGTWYYSYARTLLFIVLAVQLAISSAISLIAIACCRKRNLTNSHHVSLISHHVDRLTITFVLIYRRKLHTQRLCSTPTRHTTGSVRGTQKYHTYNRISESSTGRHTQRNTVTTDNSTSTIHRSTQQRRRLILVLCTPVIFSVLL